MKQTAEQLIEEISDFLVVYLKSGKVGLNSFLKKNRSANFPIGPAIKPSFYPEGGSKGVCKGTATTYSSVQNVNEGEAGNVSWTGSWSN